MRRLLLAAGLVLAIGWLPAAAAQQRRTPNRPEGPEEGVQIPPGLRIADLKVGPFYVQPRVTLSNVGWDSNITGRPTTRGETSDFRASPGGGLRIALPIRDRHMITGDGQLDYLWYAETDQLRAFNGAMFARYEYTSDRFEVVGLGRYVNAQRTQTDLVEIGDETVDPEFEIFEAARERSNLVRFDGTWHLNPEIFLAGRASRRLVRLEDLDPTETDFADQLNRTEESIGGSLGFQLTAKTSLALVVDWINYDYESPTSFRDAEAYTAGVELELAPTAPLEGSVLIGYRDLAPRSADVMGFEGIVVDGEVSAQPGGFASITISGERNSYPTFFGSNIYFLRQGAGVSWLLQTVRSLAFGADLSSYEHTYPVETTAQQDDGSTLTATRLDRIYQFLGRVEWRQSTLSTIGFRVGWVNRTSNFDLANVDGLVVTTSYSLTY